MSGRHQIKRQVLELRAADPDQARRLQAALELLQRQQIAPLLAQLCDELGAGDRTVRIDQLTIDLGEVDAADFEASFMRALRQRLPAGLERALQAEQAREAEEPMPARPELEALVTFARTGTLPWWSPTRSGAVLHEGLRELLQHDAPRLTGMLRTLVREPQSLARIVAHFEDTSLAALVDLLHRPHRPPALGPEHGAAAVFSELTEIASASPDLATVPARERRSLLWRGLLAVSARAVGRASAAATFFAEVLTATAALAGLDPTRPLVVLDRRIHGPSWLEALLEPPTHTGGGEALPRLFEQLRALAAREPTPADPPAWLRLQIARILAKAAPGEEFLTRVDSELSAATGLPPELHAAITAVLHAGASGSTGIKQPTMDTRSHGDSQEHPDHRDDIDRIDDIDQAPTTTSPVASPIAQRITRHPADHARSEADARRRAPDPVPTPTTEALEALHIGDAGLVLLWPFLGHFFNYLGLIEDSRLRDLTARQRAAALLRVTATGDPIVAEYQLPLAKLLCGLPVDAPFDLDLPIREDEEAECTRLLSAVVARAEVLKEMSVPGFRGTFLLRDGILDQRDGSWLLRVERRSYDLVLERFPWAFGWVKLPWMQTAIQVEW